MDWKQIIVNTVTAIIVAVLSGVLVWLFTRTPETKEGLTYNVVRSGGFGSGSERLTFFKIDVRNKGSVKADSVNIIVTQSGRSVLTEIEARYKKPVPPGIKYKRDASRLRVNIPAFLPEDTASFALLYRGDAGRPDVTVRSNNGVGTLDNQEGSRPSFTNKIFLYVTLIIFAALAFLSRTLASRFVRVFGTQFRTANRNNSGFLLFHSYSFDLSEKALTTAVLSGQHDSIVLSNLGIVRSYMGNMKEGGFLIDAALSWVTSAHSEGVVLFNRFLHRYKEGNKSDSLADLKKALSLSKDIRVYCRNSLVVNDLYRSDLEIRQIIDA